MAQTTVSQFAAELKMPAAVLLEQLQKAGVSKQAAEDQLSEQDKTRLLDYLRSSHGEAQGKNKITLTRKQDQRDQGPGFHRQDSYRPGRSAQEARPGQA